MSIFNRDRIPPNWQGIEFDELVAYGRANGANIVNGMPWSFTYMGLHVSHENDRCYLIGPASLMFEPGDVLCVDGAQATVHKPQ